MGGKLFSIADYSKLGHSLVMSQTKRGARSTIRPSTEPKAPALPSDALKSAIEAMVQEAVSAATVSHPQPAGGVLDYRSRAYQEFQRVGLTPKEIEIARFVLQGKSNDDICQTAELSIKTVKAHIGAIFRKFSVDSRAQLSARIFPI